MITRSLSLKSDSDFESPLWDTNLSLEIIAEQSVVGLLWSNGWCDGSWCDVTNDCMLSAALHKQSSDEMVYGACGCVCVCSVHVNRWRIHCLFMHCSKLPWVLFILTSVCAAELCPKGCNHSEVWHVSTLSHCVQNVCAEQKREIPQITFHSHDVNAN